MKEPNREPALGQGALHTIEHLAATYLRNEPQWQDKIIYWGPMGCLTGNYLLMKGDLQPEDIVPLMQDTFRFVAGYEGEVPVPLRRTAVIICFTTCQWQNGSLPSICMRCWNR